MNLMLEVAFFRCPSSMTIGLLGWNSSFGKAIALLAVVATLTSSVLLLGPSRVQREVTMKYPLSQKPMTM